MARKRRRKRGGGSVDLVWSAVALLLIWATLTAYLRALKSGNPTTVAVTLGIGVSAGAFVIWRITRRLQRWQRQRAEAAARLAMKRSADLAQVDVMTGWQFEDFLGLLFRDLGYEVEMTKVVGDYGGDLVLARDGLRIVVQAKRYGSNVGQDAVRQVLASKAMYRASIAAVVTNSRFTPHATSLAAANGIHLIDRGGLHQLLEARWRRAAVPVGLLPGLPVRL